jgi:2,4-dienoyl-CoA reductase-like NADH-dependent reductase (Old Yellow Enzyme family)
VIAVGQIHDPQQAETILMSGQADMVALGRGLLYDPHWVWHAAAALGETASYPRQYERGHPSKWGLAGLGVTGKQPQAGR